MNYFMRCPFSRLLKWLFFCVCFVLLPGLLVCWGIEQSWEREYKNKAYDLALKIGKQIENIRKTAKEERYYYDWLLKVTDNLDSSYNNSSDNSVFKENLRKLRRNLPNLFDIYITDLKGNLLEEFSSRVPSKYLIKKLYEIINTRYNLSEIPVPSGQRKALEAFLGELSLLETINHIQKMNYLPTVGIGEKKNYFFYKKASKIVVMAHVNIGAVPKNYTLTSKLKKNNKGRTSLKFGLHDSDKKFRNSTMMKDEETFLQYSMSNFEKTMSEISINDKYVTVITLAENKNRLWGFVKFPQENDPRKYVLHTRIIFLSVFLIICILSYPYVVSEAPKWLSIRLKLTALLVFSTGLPLVILFVVSKDYLWEKEQSLRYEAFRKIEDSLKGIDKKFQKALLIYSGRVKELISISQDSQGNFNNATFQKVFKIIEKKMPLPQPMIIKRDGTVLQNREKDKIYPQLAFKMLEKYNHTKGIREEDNRQNKVKVEDLFIGNAQLDEFITGLLKRMGEIAPLMFGKVDRYMLINIIKGIDSGANYMFFFFWKPMELSLNYLKKNILSFRKMNEFSVFFTIVPNNSEYDIPDGSSKISWINDLSQRILVRNTFTEDLITWKGQRYLAAGMPAREIERYQLIQIFPEKQIKIILEKLKNNLIFLAFFCFCFSLGIGIAVSRQVLLPVTNLAEGVDAIEKRDFRFRIPILENDELGKLSQTFNQMMVGLEDLSIAKTIQENLFP
ncbi:MAG: HAMP domain-containing protein, partial [Candidatus Riflebacteria bacterium]|nr:HAMP domain-containing protein [Candidatus Riflebacteria bacterium]